VLFFVSVAGKRKEYGEKLRDAECKREELLKANVLSKKYLDKCM